MGVAIWLDFRIIETTKLMLTDTFQCVDLDRILFQLCMYVLGNYVHKCLLDSLST